MQQCKGSVKLYRTFDVGTAKILGRDNEARVTVSAGQTGFEKGFREAQEWMLSQGFVYE